MQSIRAIGTGVAIQALTAFFIQLPLFRLGRWQYWTALQQYDYVASIVIAAGVGSAVVARLAPKRPIGHATACLILPALTVRNIWGMEAQWLSVSIATGAIAAILAGSLAGQRVHLADSTHVPT